MDGTLDDNAAPDAPAGLSFELVIQKDTTDCGIACLSSYLGVPYAEVRAAAGRRLTKTGMTIRAMLNTAKVLGHHLVLQKDFDEHDIGIVSLSRTDKSDGHVVLFIRGAVWTTSSGALWADLHAYCKAYRFTIDGLLTRSDT